MPTLGVMNHNKASDMAVAFSDLYGKKLALLVWYQNNNGEAKAGLVTGTGFLHDGHLAVHRGSILPPLTLPLEMVWRAKAVPGELKDILKGADYCIQGTVRELGLVKPAKGDWDWEPGERIAS